MRSVVVVLLASICAMIPMLRTLASSTAVWVATSLLPRSLVGSAARSYGSGGAACLRRPAFSPAVVGEGLVGFGHLVHVLAALHARPEAVARVQQLVHEPLGHRLLAALPGVGHDPAQRQGGAAGGLDLDRDLVGRATDTAAFDLDRRLHVVERALEGDHRVVAGLVLAALERPVHDPLGQGALAAP